MISGVPTGTPTGASGARIMSRNFKLLAMASTIAIAAAGATPAFAGGTTANSIIQNTVTLDYQVAGVSQTQESASDDFVVDRKVNLVVTETNPDASLVPGQPNVATLFTVSNTSNAVIDIGLAASTPSGNIAFGAYTIYQDDGDGLFEPNADDGSAITYLDQVPTDDTAGASPVPVWVVTSVPANETNGDTGVVRLSGTALEPVAAGSSGAAITATSGPNTASMDTVLADAAVDGNAASDGVHFDEESYSIVTAALTLIKSSRVLSDPVNGANPLTAKMIPGAIVEYCIAVQNSGSATAENITISDTLPVETDFHDSNTGDSLTEIMVDATVTVNSGVASCSGGTDGGSVAGDVVTATLANVAASGLSGVYFKVEVK